MDDEKLIELVRGYPCLWQVTSKAYRDQIAKENSWKEISSKVERTIENCQRKWKSLRDCYVRKLKKVRKKKSGTSGPVYVSHWCFFEVLSFLEDTVKHKQTHSNFTASAAPSENPFSPSDSVPEDEISDIELSNVMEQNQQAILENDLGVNEVSAGSSKPSPDQRSVSPSSAESSRPPSTQPPRKKRRSEYAENLELMVCNTLKSLQPVHEEGEYELFGRQVGATLQRLNPRQRAQARLRIQHVLVDVEFPEPDDNRYRFSPY